jgi:hypothetical protein
MVAGLMTDPVAAADAVVAAIDPGLSSPGVESRDVVLVTGPWLAGATGVIGGLRERMGEQTFVEADELEPSDAPAAVVFVVSALAPLSESDCALVDLATNYTDLIVGVVAKIDAHRSWRDVLAANRAKLAGRAERYQHVQWVGAAAAPDRGEPQLDELVGVLRQRLADPELKRRNRLRAWEVRLQSVVDRYQAEAAGSDRQARVTSLRKNRDDILRGRRLSKSERTIALRSQIKQARVQLSYFAGNRCTSVRAELQEDASSTGPGKFGDFEAYVNTRVGDVVDEVDAGITKHLGDVATELGLSAPEPPPPAVRPEVSPPPLKSRRRQTALAMVLGALLGCGVVLAVTRFFAGLDPNLTIAGVVAGGVVGLLLTVWVVGIRGLLQDRAVLDRWVIDVTAALRSSVEERVATGVSAAETALTSELADRDEAESATAADRVADIDAELREHAVATANAAVVRDRRLPPLQQALDAVGAELYGTDMQPESGASSNQRAN